MTGVETRTVDEAEDAIRLDHWFKQHFPSLGYGRLQKLLRTGQVRVDGRRAKAGLRLAAGQSVRIPPLSDRAAPEKARVGVSDADAAFIRGLIIHQDDDVLVINKPAGLATQGGTGVVRHLDGMLDALTFGAPERPRLVHRLDKDTSGCVVLARNRKAAAHLGRSFNGRSARKIYWAVTAGVPRLSRGKIDLALAKVAGPGGERMAADPDGGKRAVTLYAVLERSGNRLAWLAFWPQTGRTHQIRVHAAEMQTPILGDGKYGGAAAFLQSEDVPRQLHLHAREISLPHPSGRGTLRAVAELPSHMRKTWSLMGFAAKEDGDPFEEVD
ncbi:MAG: RluA family pseudouridine synthase [Alphaproteobacteria bacterium]|nr:RluA family pseudouridine synthase [Alphaproteobacteria bacterium]